MRIIFLTLLVLSSLVFFFLKAQQSESPEKSHYQRVVAMAPSYCETIIALGESHRLVGITSDCDHEEVHTLARVGSFAESNFEIILSLKPDLVLAVPHAFAIDKIRRFEQLGIKVFAHQPDSLADIRLINEKVALLLGIPEKASLLNSQLDEALDRAKAIVRPHLSAKFSILFSIADTPFVVAGHQTFIAEIAEIMGFENLAKDPHSNWPIWPLEKLITSPPSFLVLLEGKDSFNRYNRLFTSLKLEFSKKGLILLIPERPILFSPSMAIIKDIEYFSSLLSSHI